MRYGKIILFLSATVLSCVLQIIGASWGYPFDLALVALVVISFFGSMSEVLISSTVGVLLLQWRPGFSMELLLIFFIPILTCVLRKMFPWRRWFAFILLSLVALVIFNAEIVGLKSLFSGIFLTNVLVSLSYGLIIFSVFLSQHDSSKTNSFGFKR